MTPRRQRFSRPCRGHACVAVGRAGDGSRAGNALLAPAAYGGQRQPGRAGPACRVVGLRSCPAGSGSAGACFQAVGWVCCRTRPPATASGDAGPRDRRAAGTPRQQLPSSGARPQRTQSTPGPCLDVQPPARVAVAWHMALRLWPTPPTVGRCRHIEYPEVDDANAISACLKDRVSHRVARALTPRRDFVGRVPQLTMTTRSAVPTRPSASASHGCATRPPTGRHCGHDRGGGEEPGHAVHEERERVGVRA